MNTKKLSVIIPCYKAHKTIERCLHSICSQSIIDDLEVIMVNDCCPEGDYSSVIKKFGQFVSIRETKLDVNGGPGLARQKGIDVCNTPYIAFIDADDTFNGSLALEQLMTVMESNPANVCVSGTFLEMHTAMECVPRQEDMVWVFGKMYKKEFLDKYGIRFNATRANEDTGFNTKVKLLCGANAERENLIFYHNPVYIWHEKKDSITRVNNCQYSFDQSFCGWTDNMIEVIQFCRGIMPFNSEVDKQCLGFLLNLYRYYIETIGRNPIFAEQNWEYVKKYYNTVYKSIEDKVTPEIMTQMYSECMAGGYATGSMMGIIPALSITEFMNKLKTEPYNPDDIYEVWAKLPPELKQNNVACGVCEKGYDVKKEAPTDVKK